MRRLDIVAAATFAAGGTAALTQQVTPATQGKPAAAVAAQTVDAPDIATLRAAAARNQARAQYDLGVALACGRGVQRDRAEAAAWFDRAAPQGHAQAQRVLGWMSMTGTGVGRDDASALRWLRSAAEQGNTSAQNNLGVVYSRGRGVPVERGEAEKWFRKAAEQGAADAARNLEVLRKGSGTPIRPSAEPPVRSG